MRQRRSLLIVGILGIVAFIATLAITPNRAMATTCTPTGFVRDSTNLTAAVINPASFTGTLDATGCNIGIYINSGTVTINSATIFGANYYGIVNNGANVTVSNSTIHNIGENPFNGSQHGVGIYFAYGTSSTGAITNNTVYNYQKGGIVVNGDSSSVPITGNTVTGLGPVNFIAQNGIQVGYSQADVSNNIVSGNSYTGSNDASSGGVLVIGGPFYGGSGALYATNTQVTHNSIVQSSVLSH